MKIQTTALSAALCATLVLASTLPGAARPDTRYMTCAAATALVQNHGAVILGTSAHVYDKYVKNKAYCNVDQHLKRAYVPTADYRRCNVGYKCEEFFKRRD